MKTIPTVPTNWFNPDKKILVLGARGMLGSDCVRYLEGPVHGSTRQELDVTDPERVHQFIEEMAPSVVINATAYTAVDLAEAERIKAELLNAHVPRFLAEACAGVDATLVHFGTDQVFDGTLGRPHREDDAVNPLNWYARTKLEGESAVLAYENSLVLRVQWLYGEAKDRFSPLRDKQVFTPFADQIGAPTWTRDIVECLPVLLSRETRGLFHFTYDDHASWAEVFGEVKKHWHLEVDLQPKMTEEFALPANRPLFSALSNEKLKKALGVESLGSWKDSLLEFLDRRK